MYTSEQITVLELLGADRPLIDRRPMFHLVEASLFGGMITDIPGKSSKPFAKRKLAALKPMDGERGALAARVRTLMDLELPRRPGGQHPFWGRDGVNELASVVAYLGYEHFFPEEFHDGPMMEAVETSGLPSEATDLSTWIGGNLAAGTANGAVIYRLMFDLRSKNCVRLAEGSHEDNFAQVRDEVRANASKTHAATTYD